ncbi:hypothetical protein B484DRAFT_397718 [Ochromonadaceae sp. CCMP2298]|nr:hypothetical protein B484DRAFT_397718 [Ochromonadaceae sp. CCMP2298]
MKDGEIAVHEVMGIGAGTHPGETGFLVFCKSRVPKLDFYKWYIRIILLDGEAAQIAPFLQDTQIRQLCDEQNILVGKPSGSTTATTQALDAGPLFNTSKGGVAQNPRLEHAATLVPLDPPDHYGALRGATEERERRE